MPTPVLSAKFYIPRPRTDLLPRPRLVRKLAEGLANPLVLISAPAGFGKTTLLSEWVESLSAQTSSLPPATFPPQPSTFDFQPATVSWLSLEPEDNDTLRFLTYLVSALDVLRPGFLGPVAALLRSSLPPQPNDFLAELLARLGDFHSPFALVLEDYHLITEKSIHQAVAFLVNHLPPQMHVIISGRVDPPIPLARLRLQGRLTEIRTEDLRFTHAECLAYLNQILGLALPDDDIAQLEARTEGWIAGLKLAALSLQNSPGVDSETFVNGFGGSHHYISDYLIEEVLDGLPDELRDFLLQTSITTCLQSSLCDALTGQRNGQAMLETLERENLFVTRLDDDREWFRYHHLFADLLRRRLEQTCPGRSLELHRRAAAWYEAQGWPQHAVEEALAGRDFAQAARLIDQVAPDAIAEGEKETLARWLQTLPAEVRQAIPRVKALLCPENPLTPRECEVLHLIAGGSSNREIAQILVVSPGTVKKHLNNIFAKLDAQNRTQAAAHARERGWI